MLDIVKKAVKDADAYPDWNSFYKSYILSTQDYNLKLEFKFLKRKNHIDVAFMQSLIQNTIERLKDI